MSSVQEEEESMYEIPQLRRTVSDCGYEKAVEVSVSVMSKSTSSDEQVIVTGKSAMYLLIAMHNLLFVYMHSAQSRSCLRVLKFYTKYIKPFGKIIQLFRQGTV